MLFETTSVAFLPDIHAHVSLTALCVIGRNRQGYDRGGDGFAAPGGTVEPCVVRRHGSVF
jgi:hypothetical protein